MIGKANSTAQAINSTGGEATAVVGDILDDNYIVELVKKTAEFGEGKIHIIVNNAGFTWDGVIHKVFPSFYLYSVFEIDSSYERSVGDANEMIM